MSVMISIHQRNRGIFVDARNYAEPELLGMYLKIAIGKDEISLHLNSKQDARRFAQDILTAIEPVDDRDESVFDICKGDIP